MNECTELYLDFTMDLYDITKIDDVESGMSKIIEFIEEHNVSVYEEHCYTLTYDNKTEFNVAIKMYLGTIVDEDIANDKLDEITLALEEYGNNFSENTSYISNVKHKNIY